VRGLSYSLPLKTIPPQLSPKSTYTAALFRRLSSSAFYPSLLFAVLILLTEEILFAQPQGQYLKQAFSQPYPVLIPQVISTLLSFLLLIALVWMLLSIPRKYRLLPGLILPISYIAEIECMNIFNRFLSVIDLQTIDASPLQSWGNAAKIFFSWSGILPVIVYILLFFVKKYKTTFLPLLLALPMIAINLGIQSSGVEVNWGTVTFRFSGTVIKWLAIESQTFKREALANYPHKPPQNNIIFIIDESIRSDHLSINGYQRETTPHLEQIAKRTDFYNWGTAISGATCSTLSNDLLMTGLVVSEENISKYHELLQQYPTLFQFARARGYATYYFNAQTTYMWNGLSQQDLGQIDHWVNTTQLGNDFDADLRAAASIREIIQQSTGNFIVLNKRGVHYPYEESYPENAAIWTPIPKDYFKQPGLVTNPYDNGIRFSVDMFFNELIPDSNAFPENSILIYTSDHSQTLFENGIRWPHCNFSQQEVSVPLFMIGNLEAQPDTTYKASHSNIFPTILDLMAVPENVRIHPYAPSLLSQHKDVPVRSYVSGGGKVVLSDN
jgi:glucan phosphoethanolaminetransferase (alkaline phosphatase superfamily)